MKQFDSIAPWQVGFYDADGQTEKGTLYGSDVLSDGAGELLDGAAINQLGAVVDYDGIEFNLTITESGYVNIYQPSDFTTVDYLSFINTKVAPYLE